MDIETVEQTPNEFETLASTWVARRADIEEVCAPLREWMLRTLAPRAGETVLELAAGTGDTGFEAARVVGEHGRLISSDVVPAMVDAARRRGDELGVANAEYRVIDAEQIALEDGAVDGVLCRLGYMLMSDQATALAETRRVLRGGGRLVLAVWGAPERNPFFAIAGVSLTQRGHLPPPQPPGPPIFSLASAQRTSALLADAGFDAVRTEEVAVAFEVSGVDDYLRFIADTAGPLGLALRNLSEADRAGVRTDAEDALSRFAVDGGHRLPGVALCAVAR